MDKKDHKLKTINKNILDLFWNLGNKDSSTRIKACAGILRILQKIQSQIDNKSELSKDLQYSIERLVKGLGSPREAARLGYSLLLTEVLKEFKTVEIEQILDLMKQHLQISEKLDKKDAIFGQLFAFAAVIRSGRLSTHSHLSFVVISLYDLSVGRNYIVNTSYELFKSLFTQVSADTFKENVWPHIKKKLICSWENCSAEFMWFLLLCHRFFPESVSSKFIKKHYGSDDLFSVDNLANQKRLIKQTTSSLPLLHPLCTEFIELLRERKNKKEIWNLVINENLFDEQIGNVFVGFEMIKRALQDIPTKKMVKYVLSPKFSSVFLQSYINQKHPMNAAAMNFATFLCEYAEASTDPEIQLYILKVFLQLPGNTMLDQILKKKEVSRIIQHLSPDAIKSFCELLKPIALCKKQHKDEEEVNDKNSKSSHAIVQIGNLVLHPAIAMDIEWRINTVKFLFLHSFFTVTSPTSEIDHCDTPHERITDSNQETFMNSFFKALDSLYHKHNNQSASFQKYLQQLSLLSNYAEQLMSATEYVTPNFSVEKIQNSWVTAREMCQKLSKQEKKDGKVNETYAFQALFIQLSFLLFNEAENPSEVIEELKICCKKALKMRKHDEETEHEPPWIAVVIDILLSFLSKPSLHLRRIVSSVFPNFCSFITQEALQQILDVISQEKADESILVAESDEEDEKVEFDSGSSSEDSDSSEEEDVDEEFKEEIKNALGSAADASDAESVVMSDSEMFKLDDALSKAFRARLKTGHKKQSSEDKTLLNFRIRCFDLIIAFLKSEPPMHLVLQCIEPLVVIFKHRSKGKHNSQILQKAVSTLQILTKIKKFKNQDNVEKSQLKRILEITIEKCHKEVDLSIAQKLYSLCIFVVLCFRRLKSGDSPVKKTSSHQPSYMKIYLGALDAFVKHHSSHLFPQFFTSLMGACPDVAWQFIEPLKNYAFDESTRMYKKSQCLGLIFEAIKYAKSQQTVTPEEWLQFGKHIVPVAIENLKTILTNTSIKEIYVSELLNVIYSTHLLVKEKNNQQLLEPYKELIPLLNEIGNSNGRKFSKKCNGLRRKIIICLGGKLEIKKNVKQKSSDIVNPELKTEKTHDNLNSVEETNSSVKRKAKSQKKKKKRKLENQESIEC